GDVLLDCQMLERRVVLEHEADAALLRPVVRDVLLGDLDRTAVRGLEAGDDPGQRRLAAAARPEERRQRSRLDLEGDVVEGEEASEPLRHLPDRDRHYAGSSLGLMVTMA